MIEALHFCLSFFCWFYEHCPHSYTLNSIRISYHEGTAWTITIHINFLRFLASRSPVKMGPSYITSTILFFLVAAPTTRALEVAPGSSCASLCLDDGETDAFNSAASSTNYSDITCQNSDFSTIEKGIKLKSCLECLAKSKKVHEEESDIHWYLCKPPYISARDHRAYLTRFRRQYALHLQHMSLWGTRNEQQNPGQLAMHHRPRV